MVITTNRIITIEFFRRLTKMIALTTFFILIYFNGFGQINTNIEYKIINVHSGKVLSIQNGSKGDHAKVVQWDFNNLPDQKWKLVPIGSNYIIINVNSGKAISLPGGSKTNDYKELALYTNLKGGDQRWKFIPKGDNKYIITSPLSTKAVCFPGSGRKTNGTVAKLYTNLNGGDQIWRLEPYTEKKYSIDTRQEYRIVNRHSGMALSIQNQSKNDLAKVVQRDFSFGSDQKWKLVPNGNNYIIINVNSGKAISLPGDGKRNDYKELALYTNVKGGDQVWKFIPKGDNKYIITSPLSTKAVCFPGSGRKTNGTVAKLYTNLNGGDQIWRLELFDNPPTTPLKGTISYGSKINLYSAHGKYLVAGLIGNLNATSSSDGFLEYFTILNAANPNDRGIIKFGDKINLKSVQNKFVVAESNGTVNANRPATGPWEGLVILNPVNLNARNPINVTTDKVCFKSVHNKYLVAESNGVVNANRDRVGAWEQWTINYQSPNSIWMSRIPDNRLISQIAVPGTHDAASYEGVPVDTESSRESNSWTLVATPENYENQAWKIDKQLRNGIRMLDIRISGCGSGSGGGENYTGKDGTCFPTRHGHIIFDDNLASHVLLPVKIFLNTHQSEVIFMSIKSDFGSGESCSNNDNNDCDDRNYPLTSTTGKNGFERLILRNPAYANLFYKRPNNISWSQVTLENVRGKIVLIDRASIFDNNTAINFPRDTSIYLQDKFEIDWDNAYSKQTKKDKVIRLFNRRKADRSNNFYFNFLSSVDTDSKIPTNIDDLGKMGNQTGIEWFKSNTGSMGIFVLMDSVDDAVDSFVELTNLIIQSNFQ